ncbi:MAG: glutamate-1-semialdehyde 2,1-aminomutase [Nitrospinae bacterium]|nr:glutamate-1-semialdehyde 2,1-aminomutase [Nitrospinota bacterium]
MAEQLSAPAIQTSQALLEEAQRYIPGGVNSPVRAFRAVGGIPRFIARAAGSKIYDVDGREYIDYLASWGPLILGHAHPQVVRAVQQAAENGTSYGAPTQAEVTLARMLCAVFPSMELVRLVSSGTEAAMSAIRLARGYTKRDVIVKFDGCYHGHSDGLLVQAGSGATTFGIPNSGGVPGSYTQLTLSLPFNQLDAVRVAFSQHGQRIAAVVLEPIPGNMGVVLPAPGFLQGLRELTQAYGALLIFDEVITGFRVQYGGAQHLYGITPDLTCLGKIVGGGLPVGAFGGKREVMEQIAPLGPVYQAGTLSGNPLAVAAGIETLRLLQEPGLYERLESKTQGLCEGVQAAAKHVGVPVYATRVGSMFCVFFTHQPVTDYASANTSDTAKFRRYFHALLDAGVYIAPSQFEAGFVSTAHTDSDIERTIEACSQAFAAAARG